MRLQSYGRRVLVAIGLVGLLFTATPTEANATIVERIVAVVGNRPILLSHLRDRARPYLAQIYNEVPAGAQQSAAISQVYKAVLERMIDEELQRRAASRAQLRVTAQEVDQALESLARQNNMDKQALLAEVLRTGLTEQQYREELRRQVLETKLIQLRLQGRIRVNEDEIRAAYRESVAEERRQLPLRIATVVLDTQRSTRADAEQIAARARSGADFAQLAQRFSVDHATAAAGGLLPPLEPERLPPSLQRAVLELEVGEVTAPVRVGDKWVVAQLVERGPSNLPPYEAAKARMQERVYAQKIEEARRNWLDNLRRRTYVDIRL